MIKELENFSQLSKSEQADAIAKLQKELDKLKEEYDKTKDEIKEVKTVYTYKFAVKDTAGKGVQGLTLTFTNIDDSTKVYAGTSDENGDIIVKGIAEGTYKIAVTHVPTGYKVVQKGKLVSEVKSLFRPEAEVKAENNAEEATAEKKDATVEIPEYVTIKGGKEDKKEEKDDEKVIEGGTIVVEKEKDDEKKPENNKKPEKENNKKPAKPAKEKKALPKAGAAAEAATIAAAAMATMGGAYLSLKKRK